jgi:CrcB protein
MRLLFIGLGGFIGSVLRYVLTVAAQGVPPRTAFPIGTLVVNVVGCFFIGLLAAVAEVSQTLSPEVRAFLAVGVLGGFTTFSAFANETVSAARGGAAAIAIVNVVASVALGLVAVWGGRAVAGAFLR